MNGCFVTFLNQTKSCRLKSIFLAPSLFRFDLSTAEKVAFYLTDLQDLGLSFGRGNKPKMCPSVKADLLTIIPLRSMGSGSDSIRTLSCFCSETEGFVMTGSRPYEQLSFFQPHLNISAA